MDETQRGNEGGTRGQWMKHKGGNEGGTRGQWMKHKGGNEGCTRAQGMKHKGGNEGGTRGQWMKHKGGNVGGTRGQWTKHKGGNEEGTRGQWMKHKGWNEGGSRGQGIKFKGGMKGARGARDETQGGMKGGQGMKHKPADTVFMFWKLYSLVSLRNCRGPSKPDKNTCFPSKTMFFAGDNQVLDGLWFGPRLKPGKRSSVKAGAASVPSQILKLGVKDDEQTRVFKGLERELPLLR